MTWGETITKLSALLWPQGEAEDLVSAHRQQFVSAMVDIQTWAPCWQQDNTSLYPHCSTFYNCGLTVIPAPRGNINRISVVDRINPDTGKEDATAEIQWCSEIQYAEVPYSFVRNYIDASFRFRCCLPFALFFGIPGGQCSKAFYPTPTDEGLPAGLPLLPLGNHYAQTSTDAKVRALEGRWALERGKIYIGPWIQSTETIKVVWDGIKREWNDADPIEDDPLLQEALMAWVMAHHRRHFERDATAAPSPDSDPAYNSARARLIHECIEESRGHENERSLARRSPASITVLFFNDEQRFTAECPAGTTGNDVLQVIAAGTIGSSISKEDANAKALQEAQRQAQARLVCTTATVTYWNDEQTYTAQCQSDEAHPPVEGSPVTETVPANTVSSTVSKAAANAAALAMATANATARLTCTWWNKAIEYTAECPEGTTGSSVTKNVAAHTYSSTISQTDADAQATAKAKLDAEAELVCDGSPVQFLNTRQEVVVSIVCPTCDYVNPKPGIIKVTVVVAAGRISSSISQGDANNVARSYGQQVGTQYADNLCTTRQCGNFTLNV